MKQKLKLGPNNPELAGKFITKLKTAVDLFESRIHTYDRYKTEKAYSEFVETYLKLLSMVEDYYSFAKASIVLDIVPDKMAKLLRVETACEKEEQAKFPDPCTNADNIPNGHQMLNKLATLPNFKSGHQMSIVQLFMALQHAHNTVAEVTGHLAFLGCTLHPDQFSFILKHSVRPLIQLSVLAGLSDPTCLQFEHPVLMEEEQFKGKAIYSVLPMPHHPDVEKLPPKDPTCCLAGAVHYVLICQLFKNNLSQGITADTFQVERKKFYQAITGKTYDAGKKLTKTMKMQKEQKEVTEKLAKLKEQPAKPQKQEKQEVVPPDDEDNVLYCDTDDNDSLPDLFASQSTVKMSDTKEDQTEDKATGTSEVMDTTDMLELG